MSYFPSENVIFPVRKCHISRPLISLTHVEHDKHWNYFKVTCKHQGCIHKTRPGRIDRHQAKCNFRPCSSDQAAEEEEKKEVVEEESEVEEFDEQEVSTPRKRKFIKERSVYISGGSFFCLLCTGYVCDITDERNVSIYYKR